MIDVGTIRILKDYEGTIHLRIEADHPTDKYEGLEGHGETLYEALEDLSISAENIEVR